MVAIVSGYLSKSAQTSAPKVVQTGQRNLSPETPPCFDNLNKTPAHCPWSKFELQPKASKSTITLSVTLNADFTMAPGPYADSNGCTNDVATTDKWRAGDIALSCADGNDGTGDPWPMEGPGRELEVKHFFRAKASCNAFGLPIEVRLIAKPRGCSSMRILDGILTYTETVP